MTKVLIIQEASRHLENFEFRECLCLERAFQENGWEPTVYGKGHPSFSNKLDFNSFDFILAKLVRESVSGKEFINGNKFMFLS
jgi:hypothetical protein